MTAARVAIPITMPRLSDSMEEGTILEWLKQPGDPISVGEPLCEIETDKATMVYEVEVDGILGELLVGAGESAPLGAPIADVLVDGAVVAEPAAGTPSAPAPAAVPTPARPAAAKRDRAARTRHRASPVARRIAAELGIDLGQLSGSGPRGRIVRADVLAAAPPTAEANGATPACAGAETRLALTATQKTIARRMAASRSEIPDFTVRREIDMTAALALRRELLDQHDGVRLSINDLVVKAAALALREQPALNASWGGDHVVRYERVNVGVAVATDDALLVPVIFDADRKQLFELSAATRAAGVRARTRSAAPEELAGGTFTVTNLGMFDVLGFDAVIDAPQVAILAVGSVVRRPAFDEHGGIVARDLMQVSLSCDHRAVYGADAARFLVRLSELLEHPVLLLMPPRDGANEGDKS